MVHRRRIRYRIESAAGESDSTPTPGIKYEIPAVEKAIVDVVPEQFIWTVNWLHFLDYEPISCTSSTRHLVCTGNNLGQTVSSY